MNDSPHIDPSITNPSLFRQHSTWTNQDHLKARGFSVGNVWGVRFTVDCKSDLPGRHIEMVVWTWFGDKGGSYPGMLSKTTSGPIVLTDTWEHHKVTFSTRMNPIAHGDFKHFAKCQLYWFDEDLHDILIDNFFIDYFC